MKKMNHTRLLTGSILSIAAVLFLAFNITSGTLFKAIRWDFTGDKLYTLSTGSKQIITDLQEPIILRLYFSKKLAKVNPYLVSFASRVQDLLTQYSRASKGKIIVEIIDPEPFSTQEDEAVNYGLQGMPYDNNGVELYLGLVGTNSIGTQKVIPFLQPVREVNLEYDISQLVYNLAHPQAVKIGVMSSLPLNGQQPWAIWDQLEQAFSVQSLDTDANEIPADISTLMIVNPDLFSADALRAIDKFVMRGGHVLAFVDPYTEVTDQQTVYLNRLSQGDKADNNNFNALLASWGVELASDKVVADRSLARTVRLEGAGQEKTLRYPFWIDCTAENFSKEDVLTTSFERITFASPGALSKVGSAASTFAPLITTNSDAMLVDKKKITEFQQNYEAAMRDYIPEQAYVLAARISGSVKSAYTDQSVPNSNIVVVADSDLLHNHFWLTLQTVLGEEVAVANSGNGNFVLSALDNLSGSDALISIRNRGAFTRPFTTIAALELKSQEKYLASEQLLQQRLEATKQKLVQLELLKKEGNTNVLREQQLAEEEAFRQELVETRRELREVRRKLNQDIEKVETKVKFYSIGLIPSLIIMGGIIFWWIQIRQEYRTRK